MSITLDPPTTHEGASVSKEQRPRRSPRAARFAQLVDAFYQRVSSNSTALFDQAVVSAANFATSVLIGRWCGLAELGTFSLACTVIVFALGLQESFITAPYVVFIHRTGSTDRRAYAGNVLKQSGALTLILSVALALIGAVVFASTSLASFSRIVGLLAVVLPGVLLREFARRMAFAHFKWTVALVLDAGVSAIQILAVLVLGLLGFLSAELALIVVGISTFCGGAAWLLVHRSAFHFSRQNFMQDLREHWIYGRWLCADRMTSIASSYSVAWLVALLAGLSAAGGLAACLSVVAAVNPILMGLTNAVLPRASRSLAVGGVEALRRELAGSAVVFTTVSAAFAATLALCGASLLQLAYGDEFVHYWPTLNVLSASLLVGMMSAAADFGLRTMARPSVSFVASFMGMFVTVALALVLAPSVGAIGAAFGVFAGEACASLVCWFAFHRLASRAMPRANLRIPNVELS